LLADLQSSTCSQAKVRQASDSPQVSGERDFFAAMVVDAVSALDPETLDMSLLGMKKVGRHCLNRQHPAGVGRRALLASAHSRGRPRRA